MRSWDIYDQVAKAFPRVGDTGIRFHIEDLIVDLLPFGSIENPYGVATPPSRGHSLSVWAFQEVHASALSFSLINSTAIKIPTVAGFAATKIGAWLDRSQWQQAKDAVDLALIVHWYTQSADVEQQLYETPAGQDILIAEGMDIPLAAAHLLGKDIVTTLGPHRSSELTSRWPGDSNLLIREFSLRVQGWPKDRQSRSAIVQALTRGLHQQL